MVLPRNTIGPSRRDQPQDREAERGLAGTGFADDAERLALAHLDVDAVDRLDMADHARSTPRLIGNQTLRSLVSTTTGALGLQRRRIGLRLGGEQRAGVGMLRAP